MAYKLYYNDDNKYKLNQLLEVSDPKRVIINAQKYFKDPNIKVYLSPDKNKKYAIYDPNINKLISFCKLLSILIESNNIFFVSFSNSNNIT